MENRHQQTDNSRTGTKQLSRVQRIAKRLCGLGRSAGGFAKLQWHRCHTCICRDVECRVVVKKRRRVVSGEMSQHAACETCHVGKTKCEGRHRVVGVLGTPAGADGLAACLRCQRLRKASTCRQWRSRRRQSSAVAAQDFSLPTRKRTRDGQLISHPVPLQAPLPMATPPAAVTTRTSTPVPHVPAGAPANAPGWLSGALHAQLGDQTANGAFTPLISLSLLPVSTPAAVPMEQAFHPRPAGVDVYTPGVIPADIAAATVNRSSNTVIADWPNTHVI